MVKHHKNPLKTAIRFLFTFVLSLSLTLLALLAAGKLWIYNGEAHMAWFSEADYTTILENIEHAAESATIPTGMDASVFADVFTVDQIRLDIRGYFQAALGGSAYTADTTDMEERLSRQVWDFIESHEIQQTDSTPKLVEAYVAQLMELYDSYVNLSPVKALAARANSVHRLLRLGMLCLGGLSLALVVLLALLREKFFASLGYALGGAALMLSVGPELLLLQGKYANLQVTPPFFKHYVTQLCSYSLQHCVNMALLLLEGMLVCILLSAIPFYKLRRRK